MCLAFTQGDLRVVAVPNMAGCLHVARLAKTIFGGEGDGYEDLPVFAQAGDDAGDTDIHRMRVFDLFVNQFAAGAEGSVFFVFVRRGRRWRGSGLGRWSSAVWSVIQRTIANTNYRQSERQHQTYHAETAVAE